MAVELAAIRARGPGLMEDSLPTTQALDRRTMPQSDVSIERLEDQLQWYDRKASSSERLFKRLKKATLTISVLIPLSAAFSVRYPAVIGIVAGTLGAMIALLEG